MAVSSNGSLLPTSEQTLLRFCSHLADRLHHSSIKVYLSAIRSLHIDQGFPDPLVNCLQIQRLLRGINCHQGSSLPQRQPVTADLRRIIQRSLDAHNSEHVRLWAACCLGLFGFLRAGECTVNCAFDPSRGIKCHQGSSLPQRQPVTADLRRIIQRSLDAHNSEHVRLWAACCLGLFGFLRAGECTVNCTFDPSIHLTVQDLQVDAEVNPSSLRVRIKSCKTDPFRQGCFIYLGRGQAPLCPISAILAYLHRRGPSSGPLFIDTHGQPLTRSRLSSFIQSVLQGEEIPGQFSGHSFRIGAATTAAQCGIPDHLIKTMGRWSNDAYQLYVRPPVESILEVSGRLLQ